MSSQVNLTPKQKLFCLEYLKDFNATKAAIRAGYSKKTANEQGARLLVNVSIKNHITNIQNQVKNEQIMSIKEIQERLTSIARGNVDEEVVVIENKSDFTSKARIITKKVSLKDQTKALELLGKSNGLFIDKVQNMAPPQIIDDIELESEGNQC